MRQVRRCPVCKREAQAGKKYCPFDGAALEDAVVPDESPSAPTFSARLVVDSGDGPPVEVQLDTAPLTIGRAADNRLALSDPTLSRNHAVVIREDSRYLVADVKSTAGTFVNEQHIGHTRRPLASGDVIRVGRTSLTFIDDTDSPGKLTTSREQAVEVATEPPPPPPPPPAPPPPPSPPPGPSDGLGYIDIRSVDGAAVRIPIRSREVTVGRSPDCDVVLTDNTVSRRHAQFRFDGATWRIANLGRNPISVNGSPIGPDPVPIRFGDQVAIGSAVLTLGLGTGRLVQAVQPPTAAPPSPQPAPRQSQTFKVRNTGELVPLAPPPAPAVTPQPGQQSMTLVVDGKYALDAKIAEVSTGTVYRARRLTLGDQVAVRILRPDLVGDPAAVERFRRQAQVAARIRHPNVVQIYDFGVSHEGAVFIVEELLSGRTLRDLVREQRGLSLSRITSLFNQICGAVHAANLNGIVLRDLKPDSIFVERSTDGRDLVKVGGFGLAKIMGGGGGGAVTVAAAAKVYGTPEYMSPEQWVDRPLDSRSDVYSLGIILFELLTGLVPFSGQSPMQVAQMHLQAPVPNLQNYGRPDLDEGVATVVARALSKEPALRQPTALHLASEFEAIAGSGGGFVQNLIGRATGLLPVQQAYVAMAPAPVPAGEAALPSVVATPQSKGRGAMNPVVLALMAEAFLSRISSGLVKTSVPLFALLVFGFNIASVMILVLIQNVVPLLLRPLFGTLADKYGKKRVFMFSLFVRTVVGALYAIAVVPWLFYAISFVRGVADSAKGPSASAMIADATDERHIATAYSWYTTIKSTSGGIGEAVAAFMLVVLITTFAGFATVTANVAVLDELNKSGQQKEMLIRAPEEVTPENTLAGDESHPEPFRVARVEQRELRLKDVPIDDLPKVVDVVPLRKALVAIFIAATIFSALSLLLVAVVIKEKKKEKKDKGDKKEKDVGAVMAPGTEPVGRPNVWAFALLGTALTAPAYMVTGEFFTILAVKLEVTPYALGWIKVVAETFVPLLFGPIFGWIADRIGPGKVIAMRSIANLATSLLFWITPWFAGTALLGVMMGLARGVDEIGKAAFKPTWGAIAAKVSSFDLSNRSRTMGILEGGVDASDLAFPVLAGILLQYLSLGWLMAVRAVLALIAEVYAVILGRKYKI